MSMKTTRAAAALCSLSLAACHQMYLTEQLGPADERVPIVKHPYYRDFKHHQMNLWQHHGNYYTMLAMRYAKENTALIGDFASPHLYYTDYEPSEFYYFPLSDKEVDNMMKLPEGTTKQTRPAQELRPLRVKDQKSSQWRRLKMKQPTDAFPESAKCIKYDQTTAFPVRGAERGLGRTLLLGPAWVAETACNAVIWTAEAPFIALVGAYYFSCIAINKLEGE